MTQTYNRKWKEYGAVLFSLLVFFFFLGDCIIFVRRK